MGGMNYIIVGVVVFVIIASIAFYYFAYKQYRRGQDTCTQLYPGASLSMMRKREECKDRKNSVWALPVAASMIDYH